MEKITILEELKESLGSFPPEVEKSDTTFRNDYGYALNLHWSDFYKEGFKLGAITALANNDEYENDFYDPDEAESLLFSDCSSLGLNIYEKAFEEPSGMESYKIALFMNRSKATYHLIREGLLDGHRIVWCEKAGWDGPVKIVDFYGQSYMRFGCTNYRLVGIYEISKK